MTDNGYKKNIALLRDNMGSVVFGKPEVIKMCVAGLLARGNILIEDVPGIGKTTLAHTLAKSVDCTFARIQFTSDLLPSDIIGVPVFDREGLSFEFKHGPIFANVVLADEINRTTPKTQSALLEAMNDHQVSVDNVTYRLPEPFVVLATQNPIEYEGTYPLPESQLDRFALRIKIGYPPEQDEIRLLKREDSLHPVDHLEPVLTGEKVVELQKLVESVIVDESIIDYIMKIVSSTRVHEAIELGISPRGSLHFYQMVRSRALVEGRDYVIPDDVKALAVPVLAHRIVLKSRRAPLGRVSEEAEQVVTEIVDSVAVPL
jgi:MoxR-like ATPase